MKRERASSRSLVRDSAESQIAPRAAEGEPGVGMPILERWAEQGLIPAPGRPGFRPQGFTGFPPLIERELPIIAVEVVE